MGKPYWGSFFSLSGNSRMEHLWDSLWSDWATGLPERQASVRVLQLAAQLPAPSGDSMIRGVSGQTLDLTFIRPVTAPNLATPAVNLETPRESAEPVINETATVDVPVESLSVGDSDRSALVMFAGAGALPFANGAANFVALYGDDFQSGLVMNTHNKTLLEGGPGDWSELGRGPDDTLDLSGDYSAGFAVPGQSKDIDTIVMRAGNDYNLIVDEDHVAPGETMTINGMPLGAGNHVIFDGSAETDGSFVFFGSQAGDSFTGGAGDDRIVGLGGADILSGGGGADRFVYTGADESTGSNYDTIADFDPTSDRIDLLSGVASWGTAITSGSLSHASFDADLGAVLSGLGAAQATWFAPDAGDLAGTIFLVVDANGVAGYQQGEDYVFAIGGAPLADLTAHTDIFI